MFPDAQFQLYPSVFLSPIDNYTVESYHNNQLEISRTYSNGYPFQNCNTEYNTSNASYMCKDSYNVFSDLEVFTSGNDNCLMIKEDIYRYPGYFSHINDNFIGQESENTLNDFSSFLATGFETLQNTFIQSRIMTCNSQLEKSSLNDISIIASNEDTLIDNLNILNCTVSDNISQNSPQLFQSLQETESGDNQFIREENFSADRKPQKKNVRRRRVHPSQLYCQICKKNFSRPYNLKAHLKIHTQDRPYKCLHSNCKWAFFRPHDLKRHELLHSGQKSYECSCGKSFSRCDSFKRHRQISLTCFPVNKS